VAWPQLYWHPFASAALPTTPYGEATATGSKTGRVFSERRKALTYQQTQNLDEGDRIAQTAEIQNALQIVAFMLKWLDNLGWREIMNTWNLYEAKNKLSALINQAFQGKPQRVTRRGKQAVIVVAEDDRQPSWAVGMKCRVPVWKASV
jgi:prevent-host-death family protein